MMPYAGRLPALWRGRAVLIVGFDPTHALCVVDGELQYIEHGELLVTWQGDDAAYVWSQIGGEPSEAAAGDSADSDADEPGDGDARE